MPQESVAAKQSRRHLILGWWALLLYLALGLVLEALHGFKVGFYLDVDHETRRLMWTLAHAHGTLLALVNLAFAFTVERLQPVATGTVRLASFGLLAALLLMPVGFFLGGLDIRGGDPGFGIVLVAVGGLILLVGVLAVARAVAVRPPQEPHKPAGADPTGKPKKSGRKNR